MIDKAKTYWAALPDAKEAAREIWQRVQSWGRHVKTSGKYDLWTLALSEYYAGREAGGETGTAGEAEELTTIKVNDVRSLGEKIVVAITSSPPHFEPKASNTDHKSARQAIEANAILETARREKGLDNLDVVMTRMAHMSGEAYSTSLWEAQAGDSYVADPSTGSVLTTGDIKYRAYHALDVVRDYLKNSPVDHQWYVFRDWVNRWDLLSSIQDPAIQEKIRGLPGKSEVDSEYPLLVNVAQEDTNDEVAVYRFLHDKTPAVPSGRMLRFCSADVVLEDGPLPCKSLVDAAQRLAPEDQVGVESGYTVNFDLLPLGGAQNAALSNLLSIHNTFGGQLVWVKPGGIAGVEEVVGGFKLIKCAEKPEAVSLIDPRATAETEKFAGLMGSTMERVSGVNAVSRGSPEALIKGNASGAALALLDAKTLESIRGLQQGRVRWLSDIATATIRQFRLHATVPQTILVLGKANRNFLRDVSGQDVESIERVIVDLGNPLAQTISGRMQILETLMKITDSTGVSIIKTPEHVFEVLSTGRIEPAMEADLAQQLNIRAENEALSEGRPVFAAFTDHHPMHMREHASVLASPEARSSPDLIQRVQAHLDEHANLWRTTDPAILMALGVPPPPPPPLPSGMPGMPGAPPMPGGGPSVLQGGPGAMPPPAETGQPGMPSLPTNPGTGERAPAPLPPTA